MLIFALDRCSLAALPPCFGSPGESCACRLELREGCSFQRSLGVASECLSFRASRGAGGRHVSARGRGRSGLAESCSVLPCVLASAPRGLSGQWLLAGETWGRCET